MSLRKEPSSSPSRRDFLGGAAGVAAGAVLLGGLEASPASAASPARTGSHAEPVRTESGRVSGIPAAVPGVTVYKGIPYAATTAGRNRWRAPQPAPSWSGVRAAHTWGPACPQPVDGIPADQVPPLSEDCLNLNVWTGAADPGERRPVFVWIYGGRNSAMWSGQPIYDGATLAAKGVVVIGGLTARPEVHIGPRPLSEDMARRGTRSRLRTDQPRPRRHGTGSPGAHLRDDLDRRGTHRSIVVSAEVGMMLDIARIGTNELPVTAGLRSRERG